MDAHRTPLLARYEEVRTRTQALCARLATEDFVVQSMPDASPAKWHLAHTTWFFEVFVLHERAGYSPPHPDYEMLFNSYYNGVGEAWDRSKRGLLSRPTTDEVFAWREHVDDAMRAVLAGPIDARTAEVVEIGLHHEQQHQELLVTDLKHMFGQNPLRPVVFAPPAPGTSTRRLAWVEHPGGVVEIGHDGDGFAYDNETPRHRTLLAPFAIADRTVTCGEWRAFMDAGGYENPDLWLSDGWATARAEGWRAPLYWFERDGAWHQYTLGGPRPVDPHEPVAHVSFYEADAYARWAGARLPLEAEWEVIAAGAPRDGTFADSDRLHPAPTAPDAAGWFGDVWQWTGSPYRPYPGYRPLPGTLGEYNGKFMNGTYVLRGGSCATPDAAHVRPTYRNFFAPACRWQFSGLRLARDVG